MLEGVFIFPVILIFFGLLASAHAKHIDRFNANHDGREDAFRRANNGCPESYGSDSRHQAGGARPDPGAGLSVRRPPAPAINRPETQRSYLALNEPFETSFYAIYQTNNVYSKVYCNTVIENQNQFPHPADSLNDWYQFSTRTFITAFQP